MRETAAFLRARESAGDAIFAYGFGSEALQYYLPELPFARDAEATEALESALGTAEAAGKSLVVAIGYEELNRRQLAPGGFPLLDDPERFEEIGEVPGDRTAVWLSGACQQAGAAVICRAIGSETAAGSARG